MIATLAVVAGSALDWALITLDVLVVAWLVYQVLLLLRGTRALQMLLGVLVVLSMFWLSSEQVLRLRATHWMLSAFLSSLLIILVVVFQDDIRRALTQVGRNPLLSGQGSVALAFYEEIVQAAARLAERRFGALIVIAREANLRAYSEDGVPVDGRVTQSLLYAIFNPREENPLHDGAVIIQDGRISHAACFLPLTTNPDVDRALGTRHRAAIGLTEETDAVVIVVSEERGTIALVGDGAIERDLDANELRARLQQTFRRRKAPGWAQILAGLRSDASDE